MSGAKLVNIMQLTPINEHEIRTVLQGSPNGMSEDTLWASCKTFSNRTQFGTALGIMEHTGSVVCTAGVYHAGTEVTPAPVYSPSVQPTSPLEKFNRRFGKPTHSVQPPPIVVPKIAASSVAPPKKVALPAGGLNRSPGMGSVAMALYSYRSTDRWLNQVELQTILGKEGTYLHPVLDKLVQRGYAILKEGSKPRAYKWSGMYKYPFPFAKPGDADGVKVKPNGEVLKETPKLMSLPWGVPVSTEL